MDLQYKYLTYPEYFWLISHPEEKVNYSEIARQIGANRKTVAENVRKIEAQGALRLAQPQNLHEEVEDRYGRAILALRELVKDDVTVKEAACLLGVSERTLNERKDYFQQADSH